MNLELAGKRALVTGSEAGIGRAIAELLAEEGAAVVVQGGEPGLLTDVVEAIRDRGGTAYGAVGELTGAPEVEATIHEVTAAVGQIDILVNSAGLYANTTWEDVSPARWLALYEANVVSAVRLIKAFTPGMRAQRFGRIIQIATGEATNPFATMPEYAASKAALVNLTVSLAKALGGTGVTVNTVSPGIVVTPRVEAMFRRQAPARGWGESWEDIEAGVMRDVLPNFVGRLGRPEEAAFVVALLASSRAGYLTGANYRVDGGSTACIN